MAKLIFAINVVQKEREWNSGYDWKETEIGKEERGTGEDRKDVTCRRITVGHLVIRRLNCPQL
jgi:hypothetical protein